MNRLKSSIVSAASFVLIASLGAQSANAQGPPDGVSVRIVNPLPIPVTGTISGTVALTAGAAVVVANTAANPVKVSNVSPAFQPFQYSSNCVTSGSGLSGARCDIGSHLVPSGKLLVIEFASVQGCLTAGQSFRLGIGANAGGGFATHALVPSPEAPTPSATTGCNGAGTSLTAAAQVVRIYAVGGTSVFLSGQRNSDQGPASFFATISGHYEDVP